MGGSPSQKSQKWLCDWRTLKETIVAYTSLSSASSIRQHAHLVLKDGEKLGSSTFPFFSLQIKLCEIFKIPATASGAPSTTSTRAHFNFSLRTQLESSVSTPAVTTLPKALPNSTKITSQTLPISNMTCPVKIPDKPSSLE